VPGSDPFPHTNSHPVNVYPHTTLLLCCPQLRGTWHGAGVGDAVHPASVQACFDGKLPVWSGLQVPVKASQPYLGAGVGGWVGMAVHLRSLGGMTLMLLPCICTEEPGAEGHIGATTVTSDRVIVFRDGRLEVAADNEHMCDAVCVDGTAPTVWHHQIRSILREGAAREADRPTVDVDPRRPRKEHRSHHARTGGGLMRNA
jgi:hypothetical protein